MSRGKKKQKIITEVRKDEVPNGVTNCYFPKGYKYK
ncbi:hypothetical protein FUSNEC_GEN_10705_04040 [Fusobacterium necrophorum subsp. funduliforme]